MLAGFDPQLAEVEFSFKVECPPFFDCKPIDRMSAGPDSASADQLSRQGLRLLPHGHPRPPQPASSGMGRYQRGRHRHRARRTAGVCRRLAQLQAGRSRHRGLSADRAQPHLAAPARAARRLPRARRLQRAHMDTAEGQRAASCSMARRLASTRCVPGTPSTLAGNERRR